MHSYQIYSAGKFVTSNKTLPVINPFDKSTVATTYLADKTIFEESVQKALSVQNELKKLSSFQKYEILKSISEAIRLNKKHLAEILCKESGKPITNAEIEIERSVQTFLIAAEECKRISKEYISLDWTENGKEKEGLIKYFPIGLVAGISPFNFPLNLAAHKIAPAIAAGCPIILKPASATPLSCLELAKIIDNTLLPKGAVSILPMDRKIGNLLVTDDRIKLLSFTGSPEIGWEMKRNSNKKKVVLELGGNAATVITESANLKEIMQKCIIGAFSYSGQICIHAQRFIVHQSKYNEFINQFSKLSKNIIYGDPLLKSTQISNMINTENAIRVEEWVNEAIEKGAELICGGKRNENYYEPTILINCNKTMKVFSEEVFGPVICINSYSTIDEAIEMVNDTKFGLQCGVFTNLISELDKCFTEIEVGGVIHNNVPTLRFDQMPYGGIKDSGLGREGVKYAMMDMLEAKILIK
jgi:acyl-CoA reductase-like NAD-dependent aldehyde dehydrogenase